MNITTYCDRTSYWLYIGLFEENLSGLVAELLDLCLCELLAVTEVGDPLVVLCYVCHVVARVV